MHTRMHVPTVTHTQSSFLCEINILLRPNSDTLNRPLASAGHFKRIQSVIYIFFIKAINNICMFVYVITQILLVLGNFDFNFILI